MRPHRDDYTRYETDTEEEADVSSGNPNEWGRVVPKSAVPWTTEQPTTTTRSVSQRRATPIPARATRTQVEVKHGPPPQRAASGSPRKTDALPRRWRAHPLLFLGLALLIAIVGYVVLGSLFTWVTNAENHWQYGYPRTAQYDEVVGHHDNAAHPSHFLALNENGQVYVIELPGGDASHARIYLAGALIGPNADLVPVTLAFRDVNGDGKLDMVVLAGTVQYVFLNEQGQFVKSSQQP
jgi:hypothetical protein